MIEENSQEKSLRDIDEITLDFDVAQATVKALCGLMWGLPDKGFDVETVDFNDVGRSGLAAAERMVRAFYELYDHYEDTKQVKVVVKCQ